MTSARDFDNTCTRYLVFLTVLFEEVASYLPQVELSTLAETATRWAKFLKTPSTSPSRTGTKRDELYRMVSAVCEVGGLVGIPLTIVSRKPLTAKFVPGTSKSHYYALGHTFTKLTSAFVIFISTTSALSKLATPVTRHPSTRVTDGRATLQAPFTELHFDCKWESLDPVEPDMMTLEDTSKLKFLVRFGRLLWYTRYKGGDPEVKANLLDFARTKLTLHDPDGRDDYKSALQLRMAQLAALSIRLLPPLDPSRQYARDLEENLVANHMRIGFSVPKHREHIRTGTPSEPILAEAAAHEMAILSRQDDGVAIALVEHADHGLAGSKTTGKLHAISTEMAWLAMVRGMAIQRAFQQSSIDIMIPVLLEGEEGKLSESKMAAILVSVESRSKRDTLEALKANPTRLCFFPDVGDNHRPVISLVMQLGVEDDDKHGTLMSWSQHQHPTSHRQYSISVAGCTSLQYPVVKNPVIYAQLLRVHDIFDEHVRGDLPEALDAVWRLKPLWQPGSVCFHWAKTPMNETANGFAPGEGGGSGEAGDGIDIDPEEDLPVEKLQRSSRVARGTESELALSTATVSAPKTKSSSAMSHGR
ncbi:hypothetical protein FRB94_010956 [Tulasnella sp. JGI-2019a]|nr:hypothetical protein FRB94_010956 [Tulasnella sp. JGI-2019a]